MRVAAPRRTGQCSIRPVATEAPLLALTGGTGFLGLHLAPALSRAGFRLRLLSRRPVEHPALEGLTFETVCGALEDEAALAALVRGADVVVHGAGLIKARSRAEFLRGNRDGTAALARAARLHAAGARFIFISSLAAREPGLSPYAFSKRAAEEAAKAAYGDAPGQLAIVRPPAIYGPWDRESLAMFKAAKGRIAPVLGDSKVAVIHADDAAGAITALAGAGFRPGCFALADTQAQGYTLRFVAMQAGAAMGGAPRLVKLPASLVLAAGALSGAAGWLRGAPPIFTLGKAREILHPDWSVPAQELLPREIYAPRIGLAEGFAQTAAWYRQAGWV